MLTKKYNSIDIETDGLDIDDKINFIGIHTWETREDPGEYYILEVAKDDLSILKELQEPGKINIFHNGKFDTKMMQHQLGIKIPMTHDTMLMAYLYASAPELIENRGHGYLTLKKTAERLLGVPNWDVGLSTKTSHSKEEITPYLSKDIYYPRELFYFFKDHLDKRDLHTYALMLKATEVYTQAELNGLPIYLEGLQDVLEEYEECLEDVDLQLQAYADINWNSPKQLQDLLYNKLKLPIPGYTKTRQPATGVEALTKLKGKHEIVDLILKRREYDKALTFLKDWKNREKNGRLYANFNLHTTVTGRTSCNGPNLQQIPRNKKLKTLFRSTTPGWEMVQLDYSQAELRFASIIGNVQAIKTSYRNGEDLHTNMASLVSGKPREEVTKPERTRAKAANFGYLYGMQAKTFVDYAKISYGVDMSLEEATRIRNRFFETNFELHQYYKDTQDALLKQGFVTSIMGRRYKVGFKHLFFPDERTLYLRKILNFPVQSAASDFILCALWEIHNTFSLDEVKICATVHDSCIMEVKKTPHFKETVLKIQDIMQHPKLAEKYLTKEIDIPIVADIEVGPWGIGLDIDDYMEAHNGEF